MSSFSVSSSRMSLFHLLSWRTFFSEDRILDLQFFYFSSFKMFLFLVTSKLSKEKSTIHSNIFPLCNAPFFFGSVPDFFVISLKKKKEICLSVDFVGLALGFNTHLSPVGLFFLPNLGSIQSFLLQIVFLHCILSESLTQMSDILGLSYGYLRLCSFFSNIFLAFVQIYGDFYG